MTELLKRIGDAVGVWLYVISGALAFAEAAVLLGMIIPGETALLVAGYFCHEKVLSLPIMIVVAVGCAIAGDSVGYLFGSRYGPSLRRSRLGHRIGANRFERVDRFLERHGGKAVFFGRLTALLRALIPSMAGMSSMHYRTFVAWNIAGGVVWGTGCVLLGYVFASALHKVEQYLTWGPLAVLAVVVVVGVGLHVRNRRRESQPAAE